MYYYRGFRKARREGISNLLIRSALARKMLQVKKFKEKQGEMESVSKFPSGLRSRKMIGKS